MRTPFKVITDYYSKVFVCVGVWECVCVCGSVCVCVWSLCVTPSFPTHKDLGVIISNNLEWSPHLDSILTKSYKTLGLIQRTFCQSMITTSKS